MTLFLDANVVFSAAHAAQGRAQHLVALAAAGYCRLVTSAQALEEARRNLALKSRGYEVRLERALAHVRVVAEAPAPLLAWAAAEGLPPKDAPILAAAAHCGAQCLVTGDARDFGALYGRRLRGVLVLTPAQALASVLDAIG
ncbi:MAG: PIN domain-containing protein [Burkholderiales bacterium]